MKRWLTVAAAMITMLGTAIAATAAPAEAQATCAGQPITVDIGADQMPTDGADVILGTNGPDIINGLGGNDRICGLGGVDTINGGPGNDVITGGSGADALFGSSGNDTIRGQGGNDRIMGNEGNDRLYGGENNDTIQGDDGDDEMWGDGGRDTMNGGDGEDRIFGGGADDTINGGSGDDTLNGQAGDDILTGDGGNDIADGGGGNNTCDVETPSNCVVEVLAPTWSSPTDALVLDRLSFYAFEVSWCCVTPEISEEVFTQYHLKISSSTGHTQTELIDTWPYHQTDFRVWLVDRRAPFPGEVFDLELVAVNAAGSTPPLTLTVVMPEIILEPDGAPGAVSTVSASAASVSEPCELYEPFTTQGRVIGRFRTRLGTEDHTLGTYVLETQACWSQPNWRFEQVQTNRGGCHTSANIDDGEWGSRWFNGVPFQNRTAPTVRCCMTGKVDRSSFGVDWLKYDVPFDVVFEMKHLYLATTGERQVIDSVSLGAFPLNLPVDPPCESMFPAS